MRIKPLTFPELKALLEWLLSDLEQRMALEANAPIRDAIARRYDETIRALALFDAD